jgi:photosystem II stability/assembly factor-like uncharacterized protein
LLGPGTGWASTGGSLLWTKDNGGHWKDISPPNPNGDSYADVFFVDDEAGWVLLVGRPRAGECSGDDRSESDWAFHLAATVDGGESWTESHVMAPECASGKLGASLNDDGNLTFADNLHGWVMLEYQSGSAFSYGTLLETSDGGHTWQETKGNPGFFGRIRSYPNGEIWVAGDANPDEEDEKSLVVSRDGAHSFQHVSLPAPAMVAGYEPTYGLPVFTDLFNGYEEVAYAGGEGHKSAAVLFATEDGGKTWRSDRIFSNLLPSSIVDSSFSTTVVDSTWMRSFAAKDPQPILMKLRSGSGTTDGAGARLNYSSCVISFVTQDVGWGNCSGTLSSTVDGGANWTDISPRTRAGALTTEPLTTEVPISTQTKVSPLLASGSAKVAVDSQH